MLRQYTFSCSYTIELSVKEIMEAYKESIYSVDNKLPFPAAINSTT